MEDIFISVLNGDFNSVEQFIDQEDNPDYADEFSGNTLLHFAVQAGHIPIIKYLISKGATLDSINSMFQSPIVYGLDQDSYPPNQHEIIKMLIDYGSDLDLYDRNGYNALILAVKNNLIDIVKLLVENHAYLDHAAFHNETALYFSCNLDQFEISKILLEYGANPNIESKKNGSPLIASVINDDYQLTKLLIDYKASIDLTGEDSGTPLFISIDNGNIEIVKLMLEHKIDPNSKDNSGNTPLIIASRKGYDQVVKLLLSYQANPNVKNDDNYEGTSALIEAAENGHLEIVKSLLKYGAKVEEDSDRETPLIKACTNGHFEIAKYLIDHNADLTQISDSGLSTLSASALGGNIPLVKLILSHGIDINFNCNNLIHTALSISIRENRIEMVEFLISNGAIIDYQFNKESRGGYTDLIFAVKSGNPEIVKILINNNVNLDIQLDWFEYHPDEDDTKDTNTHYKKGESALMEAVSLGNEKIVELLLEAGANPNLQRFDGQTAIFYTIQSQLPVDLISKIITVLLSYDADINIQTLNTKETILMMTVKENDFELIQTILKFDPDLNVKDDQERTVFDLSIKYKNIHALFQEYQKFSSEIRKIIYPTHQEIEIYKLFFEILDQCTYGNGKRCDFPFVSGVILIPKYRSLLFHLNGKPKVVDFDGTVRQFYSQIQKILISSDQSMYSYRDLDAYLNLFEENAELIYFQLSKLSFDNISVDQISNLGKLCSQPLNLDILLLDKYQDYLLYQKAKAILELRKKANTIFCKFGSETVLQTISNQRVGIL